MNRRALAWLVVALAILVTIVTAMLLGQRATDPASALLVPGFRDQLNEVDTIVVTGPGNTVLATLERGAEQWTVANREHYPADIARIRRNLTALADARIVEAKTSNPEFYERLGVEDIDSPSATGVKLTVTGAQQAVDLIVGQNAPGSQDLAYVRPAGEAASALVRARFDLGRTGGEWLDRRLTDLPAARIASVTIEHPGVETLRISRADTDTADDALVDFVVAGMPAGRELAYPGVVNAVAGVLADLKLDDVATRDALPTGLGKPVVARFETTDGLVVETSAWRVDGGTKVTFTAAGEGGAVTEAAGLNARLGGWVYTLPDYKTEQLTRRLADLLAPPQ